jgi:hypothetical protein
MENAEMKVMETMDMIDEDLKDGREFLVGGRYTYADLLATCLLARVHFAHQETNFSPHVQQYWQRMKSRNSFASSGIAYQFEDFDQFAPFKEFQTKINMTTGVFVMLGLGIIIRSLTKSSQEPILDHDDFLSYNDKVYL